MARSDRARRMVVRLAVRQAGQTTWRSFEQPLRPTV